jgi:hypothetical protein
VTEKGKREGSFHIYVESSSKERVEIRLSNPEDEGKREKCDIYGDIIKGLHTLELERVLKENPTRQFLPS